MCGSRNVKSDKKQLPLHSVFESDILELAGFDMIPRVDPSNSDRRSVDEDHAMDARIHFFIFVLFLFVLNANGKLGGLKLCVVGNPKIKSTRMTKYCDLLGKSKRTPVTCVFATDRLECLLAVSRRKADFSVFEAEDLYFSTLWDESSVLVVSEIRGLKTKPFQYGIVAMVRRDSNITGIGDLRGKRLCHPGSESSPEWNYLLSQYFEERVAPANCEDHLSVLEDRIKTTSGFFSSACKAGPWSPNEEEDVRLKNKYWNLCALCDGGDCGATDKYRGSGGSLVCFKDGIGDVLWARYEDVKAHMKFLESNSPDPTTMFDFLCEDGRLMSLTSEEPCIWLAKPWQVIGADPKSAIDVQKIVEVLSDDEHNEWEENFLHVIELYLEYVQNLFVSRTPEDYLRTVPGYLSASAMSQGNCKPKHSVKLCVTSAMEEKKCDWMSKAGAAFGIQPTLLCVQKENMTACLDSVAKKETDVVSVSPDYFYDATVKFNLQNFLLEAGNQFNDNYLSSIVVKRKSGLKKLSDLKGKKICLTRKHGIGWWSLLSALHRESLIDSFCDAATDFFGEICVVSGDGEQNLKTCCSKDSAAENDEMEVLRCLHEDKCEAAVMDSNTLKEMSDENSEEWSKDLNSSDFQGICQSPGGKTDCHWLWGHPHYLMTSKEVRSPKREEIFRVFFELGQHFGRSSRKNNPMLEIFGPFHEVKNVLFKDSSASFMASNGWNRSNEYQDTLNKMRVCSKSPRQSVPSLIILVVAVFSIFFTTDSTNFNIYSRLRMYEPSDL